MQRGGRRRKKKKEGGGDMKWNTEEKGKKTKKRNGHLSSEKFRRIALTGANRSKVKLVRLSIESARARITVGIRDAREHLDVRRADLRRVAAVDPVLRADVFVPTQEARWQTRHRVVAVGDAEVASGLVGDECGQSIVADARSAVGVLEKQPELAMSGGLHMPGKENEFEEKRKTKGKFLPGQPGFLEFGVWRRPELR